MFLGEVTVVRIRTHIIKGFPFILTFFFFMFPIFLSYLCTCVYNSIIPVGEVNAVEIPLSLNRCNYRCGLNIFWEQPYN